MYRDSMVMCCIISLPCISCYIITPLDIFFLPFHHQDLRKHYDGQDSVVGIPMTIDMNDIDESRPRRNVKRLFVKYPSSIVSTYLVI